MTNPFIFLIFGATGDLSNRKLIPALFNLYRKKMFSKPFSIVAIGRRDFNDITFRDNVKLLLLEKNYDEKIIDQFIKKFDYFKMDLEHCTNYNHLKEFLNVKYKTKNYIYYFAISPNLYCNTAKKLFESNLTSEEDGFRRVIVEKPFGRDYNSAIKLNKELHKVFSEEQIFRIDHYLGKETVQNILVTRFANTIFEPLWNRNYIDYVEITSAEALSVGKRAGYYETAGALRDMVQNHLLQVLAVISMEPPVNTSSKALRDEMVKVFQALRPIPKENVSKCVVRGQYVDSIYEEEKVLGYREEDGVEKNSKTETYVAMRCFIDNWRWKNVPFYIRTGKALASTVTEVVIHYKKNPHSVFNDREEMHLDHNQLVIRIQPDPGFLSNFQMKVPGAGFKVQPVKMDFHYSSLQEKDIPEAYERLIYDCVINDPSLYQRSDAIELTWKYVQPILDSWEEDDNIPLYGYPARSWGPKDIEKKLSIDGHRWRFPCKNLSKGKYCKL